MKDNVIEPEKVGEYIKELRQKKGLTQEQLADALIVTRKTISKIENGIYLPSLDLLKNMSDFFEVSIDELVSGGPIEEKTDKINNPLPPYRLNRIFISSVVLLALFFLFLYWANTFNKFRIYSIYSSTNSSTITGNFINTDNRKIFNINSVKINDASIEKEKYYDAEYTVYMNKKTIYKSGDISLFKSGYQTETYFLKDYIEKINVYVIDDLPNFEKPNMNNYSIVVKYIGDDFEEKSYTINFKMNEFFANNKLFYEKYDN